MKMEIGSDDVIPNPDKEGLFEDLKEGEDAVFFKKLIQDGVEYYRFRRVLEGESMRFE